MKRFIAANSVWCMVLASASLAPLSVMAQSVRSPVNLGTAGNYVALAETGITDVPPSRIVGNIGASPITGAAVHVTCAEVTGTISVVDAAGPAPCSLIVPNVLTQAISDMNTAYTAAAGVTIPDFTNLGAGDISGLTLVPGLYKWSTGVAVNTNVTLSGGPNAVWIFQISGDLLVANGVQIVLAGGAQANNIFWQVGGPTAVTIGTGAVFNGTILSAKQVILNSGATLNGRALAQTQVTLQSTGITSPGPLVGGIPIPVNTSAPLQVSFTSPASFATNVPIGNALSATFSQTMNPSTLTTATFSVMQGSTPVSGVVSTSGYSSIFTPLTALTPNTVYTATISTGAADEAGINLASNYVWSFTTAATVTVDTTPPTVISTIPAAGATNVPVGNGLLATFSEPMNPLTIGPTTFTLMQGSTLISGSVGYAGVTARFFPIGNPLLSVSDLQPNTLYTATITTGVKDLAGNAMVSNYVWSFTTGATPSTTLPTVISTVPANGATLVTTTATMVVNFSEVMDPLTISTGTVILMQGTTPVPGTVNYAGTAATFTPAANLVPNTEYSATITTGVTDLAGNALAANYLWSFTTGNAAGQSAVCLADFAVLSGSSIVNSGPTVITGDIGVTPGASVTGFPPGTVKGTIHAGDATAAQGLADFTAAYGDAVSRSVGPVFITGDIGGQTFTPGLYRSISTLAISAGNLTLNAEGNVNAVFIFQIASALTTAAGNQIVLTGGAQAYNVFWQVGTSATLGNNSLFSGSILADQSITLNSTVTLNGRLAARTGTVMLQSDTITSPLPTIGSGDIVNAASYAGTVAPGSIAAIFGNNFGSSVTSASSLVFGLPTTLAESSFEIGTQSAPLYMTSCSQANVQIPWEAAGQTQVAVVATVGGLVSIQQPATVAPFAPGIFSLNAAGTGQGAVEIAPTAVLAAPLGVGSNPVPRGGYIAIFGTGLGAVSNQPADGAPASATPLSVTTTLPVVIIGGIEAQVTFSGLAPGFAGLYQVNALVPAAVVPGNFVPLQMTIGGIPSNTVTIAVQ